MYPVPLPELSNDDKALLTCVKNGHVVAISSKERVERLKRQGLISEEELSFFDGMFTVFTLTEKGQDAILPRIQLEKIRFRQ